MENTGLSAFNWQQLLTGGNPWAFMMEVAVRAAVLYGLIWVASLLVRKRKAAQLRTSELAVMIAAGTSTGITLLTPGLGLLPTIMILGMGMIAFSLAGIRRRTSSREAGRTPKNTFMVLEEGKLMFEAMKRNGVTHEELYGVLRKQGIEHLGQLRRVYRESDGRFSVYHHAESVPGLSVLPKPEKDIFPETVVAGHFACADCGHVVRGEQTPMIRCSRCAQMSWIEAVQELSKSKRPAHSLYDETQYLQKQAY